MKKWIDRIAVLMSVGGGFLGLAVFISQYFQATLGFVAVTILLAFLGYFAFGIVAGFRFIESGSRKTGLLSVYLLLQVPVISSPIVSYQLASGASAVAGVIGWRWSVWGRFGSEASLYFLRPGAWGAGINVVALAVLVAINWEFLRKLHKPNQALQTTPMTRSEI